MARRRSSSTSWWLVVVLATACLAAAATGSKDDEGQLGEYWQKRTQESNLRNRGGLLHSNVADATNYHQGLMGAERLSLRHLLAEKGKDGEGSPATAAKAKAPAAPVAATGGSTVVGKGNKLTDHDIVG